MRYRKEIDGLRAVAVVPVILFHAGFESFSGGFVGVDVFFVISGYLITSLLIEDIEDGKFSIARFYERRARRILPALFLVMLVCLPFAWIWMLPYQLQDFGQSLVAVVFFSSNILFWLEDGYFAEAAELKPLLHTWSLAVEEQYYVLFPLLLIGLWRFGRKPAFWLIATATALSFALSEWGLRDSPSANFYLAPGRAWELLAGSLVAFASVDRPQSSANGPAFLGLGVILIAIVFYDEETRFPGVYALLPVMGTVLVILFASRQTWVGRFLSMRGFVGIGLISYSAYLWHQPLFAFARLRGLEEPSDGLLVALALASLGLAWMTWRWVETPFRTGKWPKVSLAAACSSAAFLLAIGLAAHFKEGFGARFADVFERQKYRMQLAEQRLEGARAGLCQYAPHWKDISLEAFLSNWDCMAKPRGTPPYYAVYGDSHASDKAVALRSSGLEITHLGGSNCPLLPSRYSTANYYCDDLLDRFLREQAAGDHVVVLSNRFDEREAGAEYLGQLFKFWSEIGTPVVLFSPMPIYPMFDKIYARYGEARAAEVRPDRAVIKTFWNSVEALDVPDNIRIVDTEAAFCSLTDGECGTFGSRGMLVVDSAHLSPYGARELGRALGDVLSR